MKSFNDLWFFIENCDDDLLTDNYTSLCSIDGFIARLRRKGLISDKEFSVVHDMLVDVAVSLGYDFSRSLGSHYEDE